MTSNEISELINNQFRAQNNGFDSDLYCDEFISDNIICINISVLNLRIANENKTELNKLHEYYNSVCEFIFSEFKDINVITSPLGDKKRK